MLIAFPDNSSMADNGNTNAGKQTETFRFRRGLRD